MTRKRFIKLAMANGYSRDCANDVCKFEKYTRMLISHMQSKNNTEGLGLTQFMLRRITGQKEIMLETKGKFHDWRATDFF